MKLWPGIAFSALAGAGLEAVLLASQILGAPPVLDRLARLERIALVAGFAAMVALFFGGLALLRDRSAGRAGTLGATAGILLCGGLSVGFLVATPDPRLYQMSTDPLVARVPMLAASAIGVLVLAVPVYLALARVPVRAALAAASAGIAIAGGVALLPGDGAPASPRLPDLFLISVDTLRADHLGCYGYDRPTSPALDRFCEQAIVYENAMSVAPQTIPSYSSLMTGLAPSAHRVFNNVSKMEDGIETLAERLRQRGYLTGGILAGSLPAAFANLDQGLDLLIQQGITARSPIPSLADVLLSLGSMPLAVANERLVRDASVTTHAAVRWISQLTRSRPLFLHVYWNYPHGAYRPPARHLDTLPPASASDPFGERVRRYDGEVRFTDAQLGQVLDAIARRPGSEEAWIAFTADHGEELGRLVAEKDKPFFGHSLVLYDSSVRVPLVVRPPLGVARTLPRRHRGVVSNASLATTFLDAAGLAPGDALEAPLPIDDEAAPGHAFSIMRNRTGRAVHGPTDWVSIRTDGWRLIEKRFPSRQLELVRKGADGRDEIVAIPEHAEVFDRLLATLHDAYPPDESAQEPPTVELSDQEADLLRQLGYIK